MKLSRPHNIMVFLVIVSLVVGVAAYFVTGPIISIGQRTLTNSRTIITPTLSLSPTFKATLNPPTPTPTPTPTPSSTSDSDGSSSTSTTVYPALSGTVITPIIIESRRVSATSIFIGWGPYSGVDTFTVEYGLENEK